MEKNQAFMVDIMELVNKYRGEVSFAEVVGMLEIAKSHVVVEAFVEAEKSEP